MLGFEHTGQERSAETTFLYSNPIDLVLLIVVCHVPEDCEYFTAKLCDKSQLTALPLVRVHLDAGQEPVFQAYPLFRGQRVVRSYTWQREVLTAI
jgi:hypothetical protein